MAHNQNYNGNPYPPQEQGTYYDGHPGYVNQQQQYGAPAQDVYGQDDHGGGYNQSTQYLAAAPPPPPPPPSVPQGGGYYHDSTPSADPFSHAHSYPPHNAPYAYEGMPTPNGPHGGNDYFHANSSQTGLTGAGEKAKDEYADFADRGFVQSKQSRGSVAASLAAEGAIPSKAALKMYRQDEHKGAYTRGGRKRCCGRCCICATIVFFILIIGIVCAFLLWVRPPSVKFNGVQAPASGQIVSQQSNGFLLNFTLSLDVTNPNFFGATFEKVTAKAFYPLNDSAAIGGGELNDVKIAKDGNTAIQFPFAVNYTTTIDPQFIILRDIATKCGFIGGVKSKIKVDYDLTLRTKVVLITISPTFSSSTSFDCPLEQKDIQGLLGNVLGGALGSLGARDDSLAATRQAASLLLRDLHANSHEALHRRSAEGVRRSLGEAIEHSGYVQRRSRMRSRRSPDYRL